MKSDRSLAEYHREALPLIVERMRTIFSGVPVDIEGGKHIRGVLALLVSDALGGDREKALDYAAVVDGVHLATLQHDDVLDRHTERRGIPTLWVMEGIKAPIIYGDRIFTLAQKRLSLHGKPEMDEITTALDTTVEAVAMEVVTKPAELLIDFFTGRVADVGYQKLCLTKTAPFFKSAARLGAMAARSPEQIINSLSSYGEKIGLAYQYADDLVDLVKLQAEEEMPGWEKIVPVLPAVIHYNGRNIRQALWEVPLGILKDTLTGKGPGEKLMSLLSQLDVAAQLGEDIEKELSRAVELLRGIEFRPEFQAMVRDFPRYAVNMMLAEVGRSTRPAEKEEQDEISEVASQ